MDAYPQIEALSADQERIFRWMVALSVAVHIAVVLLGSAVSPLFQDRAASPPVFVELTDAPMQEPLEDSPAPVASAATVERASPIPSPAPKAAPTATASRWLEKLDAGLRKLPEAPVDRRQVRSGDIPVRSWPAGDPARPGNFAPTAGPVKDADTGRQIAELEARVRRSGRPAVASGNETEASMMFGGAGDAPGEQLPPWIRDMIRRKVRGYLPELEEAYSAAIGRSPALQGKLIVRFRIDPSGKVPRAVAAESSLTDAAFVGTVLDRVRSWTFDPPGGRTVEVLYPFVFVSPS